MAELKRRSSENPYLSEEILSNILVRLPVKDLVRFRTVCKPWLALITSNDFTKLHFDDSKESPRHEEVALVIHCMDKSLYTASLDSNSPCQAVKLDLVGLDDEVIIEIIGCCNGLVLCRLKTKTRAVDLILVNPSTSRHKRLPKLPLPRHKSVSFGFGYDHMTDDYKVVVVVNITNKTYEKNVDEMQIYSSRANSWEKFTGEVPIIKNSCKGVLINNHLLHWYSESYRRRIFSFDVCTNKWSEVPLPGKVCKVNDIGVQNGLLCLSTNPYGHPVTEYSIFVMEEYGVKESWVDLLYESRQLTTKCQGWKIAPISQGEGRDIWLMIFRGGQKSIFKWFGIKERKFWNVLILGCPQKLDYTACNRTLVSMDV